MRCAFPTCIFISCLGSCLSLVAARAAAQEFAPAIGQTGIGRCHMDVCSFFVIEDAKPVGSTKEGILFAIAVKECCCRASQQEPIELAESLVSLTSRT